jgi:hypothetical protein
MMHPQVDKVESTHIYSIVTTGFCKFYLHRKEWYKLDILNCPPFAIPLGWPAHAFQKKYHNHTQLEALYYESTSLL